MTDARDRVREMIDAAMGSQRIEQQLDDVLEELVGRIDADPELRRQVIRNAVHSSIMANFWLHPDKSKSV